MLRGRHDPCTHVYTAALAPEAPTLPEEERSPRWRERHRGAHPRLAAWEAWSTRGHSPGWFLEAGPRTAGVPTGTKRHSGSQTHGSAVQAEGCGQQRDPTVATAHPARLQPAWPCVCQTRPWSAPGPAQAPLGTFLLGLAIPAATVTKEPGGRTHGGRGTAGPGPLRRPQGPASEAPAPRRLGGQDSRAPHHGGGGPGKGLAAWSPAGSGPQPREQGAGLGRSWGDMTRRSSSPSPPTPGQEAGRPGDRPSRRNQEMGPHPPGATKPRASLVRKVQ